MSFLSRLILRITEWGWVRSLFTRRFGRRVAMRFVAGETLTDAVGAARELAAQGFSVSLDHLGEHDTTADEAMRARDDYLACIEAIRAEGLDANVSVKLSQLGMGVDDELAATSLDALAAAAAGAGTTVTVDMEESDVTGLTIDIYEQVQRRRGNLGLALQAYLHRTPDDLDRVMALGGHIRLCKGAYDEPGEIALGTKAKVNAAFDRLAAVLMANPGVKPAIASHDEARIVPVAEAAGSRTGPFEFQMLYGVRGKLQAELVAAGHPLRVYVPYGDSWYPYLTRRIAERPSNVWFFARALLGR
ncbi:MAG: proline dehydrogenase family protein [Acidimicrobiia bacterium]|nr:proline dehydrogenase family protein [Acidimicrobiia bacterium]